MWSMVGCPDCEWSTVIHGDSVAATLTWAEHFAATHIGENEGEADG